MQAVQVDRNGTLLPTWFSMMVTRRALTFPRISHHASGRNGTGI